MQLQVRASHSGQDARSLGPPGARARCVAASLRRRKGPCLDKVPRSRPVKWSGKLPARVWHGASLSIDDPMIAVSGNVEFDRALGRQLVRLSRSFGVRPGFAYADGFRDRNAIASSYTRFPGTQSTVLMGIRLMRSILARGDGGDIAVMGVCAHEFGHVIQYFNGTHGRLSAQHATSKLVELHADFLAGYFVGETRRARPAIITRTFDDVFHGMGSYASCDPDFHGPPDERLEAVKAGQRTAERGLSFNVSNQEGARYVLARFR